MATGDYATLKAREWERPLLRSVSGLLAFETATGLAIYLLPFSVPNQMAVLFHTVAGLLFVLPFVWYQVRHWRTYRSIRLSHVVLTGYFAMTAAVVLVVSGVVLTAQALVGTRIARGWDLVHVVATFALMASAIPHVVTLVVRARRAGTSTGESPRPLRAATRRFGIGTAFVALGGVLPVLIATMAYRPPRLVNELPKDYSYAFGPGRPFAPSLATTASGGAYDARSLAGSASCGTSNCHQRSTTSGR